MKSQVLSLSRFELRLGTKLSPKFSVKRAHAMQLQLSKRVVHKDRLPKRIRYIAGVDVAYVKGVSIGAATVLDSDSLSLIESQVAYCETRFPYIPTLLSFREIPPAFSAIKKLKTQPDVFLVDGQGIAHPHRLGFATHLGLVIDKPTIGVAKSLLCGNVESFNNRIWAPITDGEEIIGATVVSKLGRKPIYVSVGHQVSLEKSIQIVIKSTRAYRIPEPIRRAHIIANEEKRKIA